MKRARQNVHFRRFLRNRFAAGGAAFVLAATLAAVFAYLIAPDGSANANRHLPALALSPPFTTARVLFVPRADAHETGFFETFLRGAELTETAIPLSSAAVQTRGDTLYYVGSDGAAGKVRDNGARVETLRFWLGTDHFGRDVLSRLLVGGRASLGVGIIGALLSLLIGAPLGMAAGYFGGTLDGGAQWISTVFFALPSTLLAIAAAFAFGKGFHQLYLAVGFTLWVDVMRVVRGQTRALKERLYIEAARAGGLPTWRVFWNHLLPNAAGPIVIAGCANFSSAVLLEAGLSFLGLGAPPPTPGWGGMLNEGYTRVALENGVWLAVFPGALITFTIVAINLAAIGLRDAFQKD